jgi:hypothetical protein
MNFVFDSTGDFPVAANPHSSKGKRTDKDKGTGQKGRSSANPSTRLRKRKRASLETDKLAEQEAQDEAQLEKGADSPPDRLPEETEEARKRKGKAPQCPAATAPSFPQAYDIDEAGVVAALGGQLPPHAPNDAFAREMFRATQPPYMVEEMKTNPELVIGRASSYCLEMGSMLVHLWDDLKKRQGESKRAQDDLRAMEHAKQKVEDELSAHSVAISGLEEENAALKQDLEASKKREEQMSHEVAVLHQKLADANPEGLAQRFLASRAFSNAAMLSCEDMMKCCVYAEFRKLGKVYPFVPEQVGYTELPIEMARPKSLRGYSWDFRDDLLVDPNGKKLIGDHKIQLRSGPGTGIQYPWPKNAFPKDPTIPPPRRPPGQQTPRLTVTVGGSSHAKATQPSSSHRAEAHTEKAPAEKTPGEKGPGEDEGDSSARQGSCLAFISFKF